MLHLTTLHHLTHDIFDEESRVHHNRPLDLDGKHIAFNCYDYRCLKDEIERLSYDMDADFGQVCPTLAGIIKETDGHAGDKYPVRENSYNKYNYAKSYLYLRLLDQILYTAESPLSRYELAKQVLDLADYYKLSKIKAKAPVAFAQTLTKPIGILKQLLSVEFDNGDSASYGRGTFAIKNNQWIYPPLDENNPNGERVTAFKMTVSINELGAIIKEMTNLRKKPFKNNLPFETKYPLLAILGDNNLDKGIFDKKNLTETKHERKFATVRYSSHLSSTVTIGFRAIKAVKDQDPVVITMLNGSKCDILPYDLTQDYCLMYLRGISFKTKRPFAIRIDKIKSIEPSTKVATKSMTKLLSEIDALFKTYDDECDITLAISANREPYSLDEFGEALHSAGIYIERAYAPRGAMRTRSVNFFKFTAIPSIFIFECMELLHRNGHLIDIYPADVKERYEVFWSLLDQPRYSLKYNFFNWSDKSDDDCLTN